MWNKQVMTEKERQSFIEKIKDYSKLLLDSADMLERDCKLPDVSCVIGSVHSLIGLLSKKIEEKNELWYEKSSEYASKLKNETEKRDFIHGILNQ